MFGWKIEHLRGLLSSFNNKEVFIWLKISLHFHMPLEERVDLLAA